MKKKNKKKISDLDKYCLFCIIFFTAYVIIEVTTSCLTGVSHDRLTEAVQWFAAGELFFCAMLKRLKLKKGDNINDKDNSRELELDSDSGSDNSRCN